MAQYYENMNKSVQSDQQDENDGKDVLDGDDYGNGSQQVAEQSQVDAPMHAQFEALGQEMNKFDFASDLPSDVPSDVPRTPPPPDVQNAEM